MWLAGDLRIRQHVLRSYESTQDFSQDKGGGRKTKRKKLS